MPVFLKAAGKWGSVLVILALIVTLLKQVIAFVGFLTMAIKFIVIIAFVGLIVGIGFALLRTRSDNRQTKD